MNTQHPLFFGTAGIRLLGALLVTCLFVGCASSTHYVDNTLKDIPVEQMAKVKDPKPVQLVFEFQSKGATNARVTDKLKNRATEWVSRSGLFSQVSTTPVAGNAFLSIVVNNVPITEDAGAQGFVTGLTFGAVGSNLRDSYVCTVNYVPGNGRPKLSATVRQTIHTTMGNTPAPTDAKKFLSLDEAFDAMLRQVIFNGLHNVASNPAFNP
jgi:hypothetical protein